MLTTVLTVRLNSERLPNKALLEIRGKPIIYWILRRLQKIDDNQIILATVKGDEILGEIASELNIPVSYSFSDGDVVGEIDRAWKKFYPNSTDFVLRALGDCPFLNWKTVNRAVECLTKYHTHDAFVWELPPETLPVYGSREFPFSKNGWNIIARRSTHMNERRHSDLFFHQNRKMFNILYHEAPNTQLFRNYRLEIDYPEDFELIKEIGNKVGMLADVETVIKLLDENEDISKINRERVEKTGPSSSYNYQQKRIWAKLMMGQPVLRWNNKWWDVKNTDKPVFCACGQLLGFANNGIMNILDENDNQISLSEGAVRCKHCHTNKFWNKRK